MSAGEPSSWPTPIYALSLRPYALRSLRIYPRSGGQDQPGKGKS